MTSAGSDKRSPVSRALTALRERAGLSLSDVAQAIGRRKSSYVWYEDGFAQPYLPMDLVKLLVPVFSSHGIDPAETIALAGIDDPGAVVRTIAAQSIDGLPSDLANLIRGIESFLLAGPAGYESALTGARTLVRVLEERLAGNGSVE